MSTKEILIELKAHIKDLSTEKDRLNDDLKAKDSRIKMLLTKIEHANDEVQSMGKKLYGEQSAHGRNGRRVTRS